MIDIVDHAARRIMRRDFGSPLVGGPLGRDRRRIITET
jgi:hypothetical protein